MVNYDAPDQVIRNLVITMCYPVSGPYNFLGIFKIEFSVFSNDTVYRLSDNLNISFNCSPGFTVRDVMRK
jgi:hypothetical protein